MTDKDHNLIWEAYEPDQIITDPEPNADGYKERGQRREGLSMLANIEKWLASDGDASSVAAVHKAIETMYMHVADVVEGEESGEDRHDGIDPEPSRSRETDQDRYGYAGDR